MQHFCYSVTAVCHLSSTFSTDANPSQALKGWPHSQTFHNNAISRVLDYYPPITDDTQGQKMVGWRMWEQLGQIRAPQIFISAPTLAI